MDRLFVIKIGGNVLDNPDYLNKFLGDFSSIRDYKILVHGGGKIATKIGDQLGIKSNYVNGRRITDEATRDLVSMVYGGLINKSIVAQLQKRACNAIGVTGADGQLLRGVKRPVKDVDYGFVGDITPDLVNVHLLRVLLTEKVTPIFAPLTYSDGGILNTNADTIASTLAIAISKHFEVRLIYCFEKKGVLKDPADENSVINLLTKAGYDELMAQGALSAGILPKLESAFAAIHAGVKDVLIGEAGDLIKNTGDITEGTLLTR